METTPSPLPRDEVLRRIGRNVVNFQYLEATLRSMIPSLTNEGTPTDLESNLNSTTRRLRKSALGELATTYLAKVFSTPQEPQEVEDEAPREIKVGMSLHIETNPDRQAEHRRSLLNLVKERNRLIHQDALNVDLNSPEQCAQLARRLDDQNERIRSQLAGLNSLRQAQSEAIEAFVRFMQTPEFMSALQGHDDA